MAAQVKSKSAEKQKSMGMKITRHRMDMNKILNDIDFSVFIEDLYTDAASPRGTRVVITFQPWPVEAVNH
jgi:Fe2+ or Zn2+ uptake regulation protein